MEDQIENKINLNINNGEKKQISEQVKEKVVVVVVGREDYVLLCYLSSPPLPQWWCL
jgi:hypothetical protein